MTDRFKAFYGAMDADAALYEEFKAAIAGKDGDEEAAAVVAFANDHGYELSARDLGPTGAQGELADDDLELVAGGWMPEGTGPLCTAACRG